MAVPADGVFELTQEGKDCLNCEDQQVVVRYLRWLKGLHCTQNTILELQPPHHRLESVLLYARFYRGRRNTGR
jgi:hypothetical protein